MKKLLLIFSIFTITTLPALADTTLVTLNCTESDMNLLLLTYCEDRGYRYKNTNDTAYGTYSTTKNPIEFGCYNYLNPNTTDLKKAVAGSLAYTVFYLNPDYDSTNPESPMYISIAPEHIEIVHGDEVGAKAYEVGFQLTTAAQGLTWYKYSSASGHEAFGDLSTSNIDATNAHLADIQPAVLYTGGDTYYIVDIKHLGAPDTITTYGIVRNHVYQLDIQSIKGYGSPGYSGFEHVVENPEYPEDDETSNYVAAKINVLSWKIVQQTVDIVK